MVAQRMACTRAWPAARIPSRILNVTSRAWELPFSGHLRPAVDPSAVIDLLAPSIQSGIESRQSDVNPVTSPAPSCS